MYPCAGRWEAAVALHNMHIQLKMLNLQLMYLGNNGRAGGESIIAVIARRVVLPPLFSSFGCEIIINSYIYNQYVMFKLSYNTIKKLQNHF